jgi:hypothetical protein
VSGIRVLIADYHAIEHIHKGTRVKGGEHPIDVGGGSISQFKLDDFTHTPGGGRDAEVHRGQDQVASPDDDKSRL